jgi:hypothetical protein
MSKRVEHPQQEERIKGEINPAALPSTPGTGELGFKSESGLEGGKP